MKLLLFILCAWIFTFTNSIQASLFLYNNSPYKLKAVVIAANGTNMGEKVMDAQETGYFEDALGQSNPVGQQETPSGNSDYSVTPYTVIWYCMEGTLYSTCTNLGAGALGAPTYGTGPMFCQPSKPQEPSSSDSY
ncbi:MAG: hypothetical protein EBZ47_03270 [Chlamydiae bacterium]|nr:hypothetical protein [Chlamydiota bacterium]